MAVIKYRTLISTIDSPTATGANIVALDGEQLVAFLSLRLSEPGGQINSVFVQESYQGQGIGRELVHRAANLSLGHGKPTLSLWVCERNPRARALYERLGFLACARNDDYTQLVAPLPLRYEN